MGGPLTHQPIGIDRRLPVAAGVAQQAIRKADRLALTFGSE